MRSFLFSKVTQAKYKTLSSQAKNQSEINQFVISFLSSIQIFFAQFKHIPMTKHSHLLKPIQNLVFINPVKFKYIRSQDVLLVCETIRLLYVYYENIHIGTIHRDNELNSTFTYSSTWLKYSKNFALILSMPLQKETFGNKITLSYFENLLPEGKIRDVLEKNYHAKGTFNFLNEFGSDCAGVIVISDKQKIEESVRLRPEKSIDLRTIFKAIEENSTIADTIAQMDHGYLSIAGAQDKFVAIYRDQKFYLPASGEPSTHIIKIPINRSGVKDSVYNEYYCMQLAKTIGLNTAHCFIVEPPQTPLFVTERYDRKITQNKKIYKIHQQDFCQAQGYVSEFKYEEKGGPTLSDNFNLIKNNVAIKIRSQNLFSYLDWICFNLLIGNNDSHSKNLSLLMIDQKVQLAPFYDMLCTAIYPQLKNNFSFKIGDRDHFSKIRFNQFTQTEEKLDIKKGTFINRMHSVIELIHQHKDSVAETIINQHPRAKIALRISKLIDDRIKGLKQQGLNFKK